MIIMINKFKIKTILLCSYKNGYINRMDRYFYIIKEILNFFSTKIYYK